MSILVRNREWSEIWLISVNPDKMADFLDGSTFKYSMDYLRFGGELDAYIPCNYVSRPLEEETVA